MNFFKALANLASKVAQDFTQPKQKLQTLIEKLKEQSSETKIIKNSF
jgi:hypothetical protein